MRATAGREAKKEDKRRRIRAAASELFRAVGYDATTTRAIAARAGIATGTLFLYARDKDEVLAMVFGDDVVRALERADASRPKRLKFVAGVAHRLHDLYALYGGTPDLALRYVRRIPTLVDAERAAHEGRNARIVAALRDEVERGVASGELRADLDVELAVDALFALVRVSIFSWLAAPPVTAESGLRSLKATLKLLVRGLGAAR